MAKRCICGRSTRLPLCDGSHADLAWACRAERSGRVPYAFVAGPHDENFAERLANELAGVAVHSIGGDVAADEVVVLASPAGLDEVDRLLKRVDAPRRRVIALEAAAVIAGAFDGWQIVEAGGDTLELWRSVRAAVTGQPADVAERELQATFLSHAVADEPLILPAVDYVRRHLDADVFLCADSIETGAIWHDTIVNELQARPAFVWLLSRAANSSSFCAFEIGYAMALNKPLTIISLDGTRPPAYVQHLHMIDLQRQRQARPWLDAREALIESLMLGAR